jgi:hypothetical protein
MERAITSFLEPGPDQLSSRLAIAIADEIHHTRRRAVGWGLGRLPRPARSLIGIASAVLVVGLALTLSRYLWQPTGSPSATVRPSLPASQTAVGRLHDGARYSAPGFSLPFVFSVPAGLSDSLQADSPSAHGLRLSPGEGAITIHDGIGLPADLCHPEGAPLSRPFASPEAVGEWLAATAGLTVSPATRQLVDGGSALSWDVGLASTCYLSDVGPPSGPAVWFQANEHHRIYAVSSVNGAILFVTWGAGYHGEGEDVLPAVNSLADLIVASIVTR